MFRNKKVATQQDNKEDDIIFIHDKILKYFVEEKNKKYFYIESIKELIKVLSNSRVPYGINIDTIEYLNNKICEYDKRLPNIQINDSSEFEEISYKVYLNYLESIKSILSHISSLDINEQIYILDIHTLIEEYKEKIKTPNSGSFITKKKAVPIQDEDTKAIHLITINFNNKIQEFIENGCIFTNPTVVIKSKNHTINNFSQSQDVYNTVTISNNRKRKEIISRKNKICDCIKKEENKITNQDNSSQITCAECGTIYNINFSENNNFYDYSRINVNQKYHYEKKCHFRDTINQYQGKQNKYIPEEVYQNLEEMLEKHGLVSPLTNSNTDRLKRFNKVTKEHIRTFLTETGFQKYYEDLHLIYSKITGKPRTDISKFEKALYEDFDQLVKVYLSLKLKRKNFLNSHYVLRQLLLKHGVKVPADDLSCLKTQQRLQEHDDIYQRCCELLNWNFTPMK